MRRVSYLYIFNAQALDQGNEVELREVFNASRNYSLDLFNARIPEKENHVSAYDFGWLRGTTKVSCTFSGPDKKTLDDAVMQFAGLPNIAPSLKFVMSQEIPGTTSPFPHAA